MTIRNPIAAGRFYPADAQLLFEQVEACYWHPLGPGGFAPADQQLVDAGLGRPPLALIFPRGAGQQAVAMLRHLIRPAAVSGGGGTL